MKKAKTVGELIASGYKSRGIKEELRDNLIAKLKSRSPFFDEIQGYDDTVIPQLQTAILSGHNIIFLGLRGQAKTRMARLLTNLLDEYIPVIAGSELNDDPLNPLSHAAKQMLLEKGNECPIEWVARSERYTEKLATPDVSVSDLIGDIDPIKAAALKLSYADERIVHYGLIPRSNRGIFVINELPDLQPRIQVSLFNMLQEGDIQIRGFKIRLPLDIQFVFTANPEDYTNRGSIITPLKDRIGSQILTHYPANVETALSITAQESKIPVAQIKSIVVPDILKRLIEQIAFEARKSEFIDQKSGVSARLTISALQQLYSAAERRMILNNEKNTVARISDLYSISSAINGKVELVYEGELEGIHAVAYALIGKAIRAEFLNYFPNPELVKKSKKENPYAPIIAWFAEGNNVDFVFDEKTQDYEQSLATIKHLFKGLKNEQPALFSNSHALFTEFVLHGLAEFSQIGKRALDRNISFQDMVSDIFNMRNNRDDEELDEF